MNGWLATPLVRALSRLDWLESESACPVDIITSAPPGQCVFRHLRAMDRGRNRFLTPEGQMGLQRLVAAGLSLRAAWPRSWAGCIDGWLGPRIYLSHARNFSPAWRWSTLVSSRLGRHGSHWPQWPAWIDRGVRRLSRQGHGLLVCQGTTLAESLVHIGQTAGLPLLTVGRSPHAPLDAWLHDVLRDLLHRMLLGQDLTVAAAGPVVSAAGRQGVVLISPPAGDCREDMRAFPLRDRLAVALADSVFAMAVRPGGTIAHLLAARLADSRFPPASVFVALQGPSHRPAVGRSPPNNSQPLAAPAMPAIELRPRRSAKAPSDPLELSPVQWLDQGAVGWLATEPPTAASPELVECNTTRRSVPVTQQICSAIPPWWRRLEAHDDWPYLCHCTRGGCGPRPQESLAQFHRRCWMTGVVPAQHPLETLARICSERVLRGTAAITRTDAVCVSWSAVPLVPLLARRRFQAHLGRWDWEPYGLLIERSALGGLGAQPVRYGTESDFRELDVEKRPYFQPRSGRRRRSSVDWSQEREWRSLGDLCLDDLPAESVRVFVRTRREALPLSRRVAWPILWTE